MGRGQGKNWVLAWDGTNMLQTTWWSLERLAKILALKNNFPKKQGHVTLAAGCVLSQISWIVSLPGVCSLLLLLLSPSCSLLGNLLDQYKLNDSWFTLTCPHPKPSILFVRELMGGVDLSFLF